MSRTTTMGGLLLCAVLLWVGAASVHGGECDEEGHRLCAPGALANKTYAQVTADEFKTICEGVGPTSVCFGWQMDECEGYDELELAKYVKQLQYRCETSADFLKYRTCVDPVVASKKCPNPELIKEGDPPGQLSREKINETRSCWVREVTKACDAETALWYAEYLDVTHQVVVKYYTDEVEDEDVGECHHTAQLDCFPPVRMASSEIHMDDSELTQYCGVKDETVSCFEEKLSDCPSYDKMLIDEDIGQLKYICNNTAEFAKHRNCLGGLQLRDDVNCTDLDFQTSDGEFTAEITEAEVNVTKTCWYAAMERVCPGALDWYKGYTDIGYNLAMQYSAGGMPMASMFTLLVAVMFAKMMV